MANAQANRVTNPNNISDAGDSLVHRESNTNTSALENEERCADVILVHSVHTLPIIIIRRAIIHMI
jgi:hypothetical protein